MFSSQTHQARTVAPPERRLPSKVKGDYLSKVRLEHLFIRIPDDAALRRLGALPANSIDEAGPPIARASSHHGLAAASQAVTADHFNVVTAEPFMNPTLSLTPDAGDAPKNIERNAQAMTLPKEAPSNATSCSLTPIDIAQVGTWANNPADDFANPSQISIPGDLSLELQV
ncbi:hypothetical protein B0I35DRAFT_476493 [Stachybotrys elegans]|uniref:Uncharacterized protein n=1 Tax=Stachybotrys elegans TaxID=80388 RepID=A0A8K0SYS2_9HYPO|nr:hypothetical protein B0I35DRAFT_476493 [Stachybotrys elegans]